MPRTRSIARRILLPIATVTLGVLLALSVGAVAALVASFQQRVHLTFPREQSPAIHIFFVNGRVEFGTSSNDIGDIALSVRNYHLGRTIFASETTGTGDYSLPGVQIAWTTHKDNRTRFGVILSLPVTLGLLLTTNGTALWMFRRLVRRQKKNADEAGPPTRGTQPGLQ